MIKNENNNCECGKQFSYLSGLSRHRKICQKEKESDIYFLSEIIKQNQEFKNMLLEQSKENIILLKKLIEICENK